MLAIETRALTKHFGATVALDSLQLAVPPGEVFGYLGPNGSGKTTTLRLLLGLARPTAGSSALFGLDSVRDAVEAHRRIAYVPGEATLWPGLTGMETLHLLARVQERCDDRYRDELVERFDLDPSRRVRAYSKGNRQKVVLIAALMGRPDLLLLDEPTSGLDPLMEESFRDCVREARERGQTVFLSSHILSEVEALCDRIGILRAGRLVDVGTLVELRHLAALSVEAYFDGSVPDLTRLPGVSDVVVTGQRLRCQVHGSIAPVLRALADADAREVLSREPSLEEVFLAHYGTAAGPRELADAP